MAEVRQPTVEVDWKKLTGIPRMVVHWPYSGVPALPPPKGKWSIKNFIPTTLADYQDAYQYMHDYPCYPVGLAVFGEYMQACTAKSLKKELTDIQQWALDYFQLPSWLWAIFQSFNVDATALAENRRFWQVARYPRYDDDVRVWAAFIQKGGCPPDGIEFVDEFGTLDSQLIRGLKLWNGITFPKLGKGYSSTHQKDADGWWAVTRALLYVVLYPDTYAAAVRQEKLIIATEVNVEPWITHETVSEEQVTRRLARMGVTVPMVEDMYRYVLKFAENLLDSPKKLGDKNELRDIIVGSKAVIEKAGSTPPGLSALYDAFIPRPPGLPWPDSHMNKVQERAVLRPSLHPFRRRKSRPAALPNELWSEIFLMLDTQELVVVSRVSRSFNADAIQIYLARQGIPPAVLNSGTLALSGFNSGSRQDIFPVLRTAFFLPPIRKFSCNVYGQRRFQTIRYLASFIGQQPALEDVKLTFFAPDPFTGFGAKQKAIPRRTVQREICRLLNCVFPTGKALIVTPDRLIISGSARCHMVRPLVAPPRGIRAKVRKTALAANLKRRKPTPLDVVLTTVGEIRGTTSRDEFVLDALRSVSVKYATSSDGWAVVILNSASITRLNLKSMLGASAWSRILPLLELSMLVELGMCSTTLYTGDPELHDIDMAELDAFLIRHVLLERLEYIPQLPLSPITSSEVSLASLPHLKYLTTTPSHFLHLHRTPNTLPTLIELVLLSPPSPLGDYAAKEFTAVLNLLAETIQDPGFCLRFPLAWISSLPEDLTIQCISTLVMVGDFPLDVAALAKFAGQFTPGLKRVELQPARQRTFEHLRLVDELRHRLVRLEDVSCSRPEWAPQRVSLHPKKTGKGPKIIYDDE
ncbi:hypothetical protein DFH06DRAFT_1303265 [Mycena polygramma]|nr:hypothetical protein DFH06DRAFT_1303265 [Mycena polygramma]